MSCSIQDRVKALLLDDVTQIVHPRMLGHRDHGLINSSQSIGVMVLTMIHRDSDPSLVMAMHLMPVWALVEASGTSHVLLPRAHRWTKEAAQVRAMLLKARLASDGRALMKVVILTGLIGSVQTRIMPLVTVTSAGVDAQLMRRTMGNRINEIADQRVREMVGAHQETDSMGIVYMDMLENLFLNHRRIVVKLRMGIPHQS